MSSLHACSSPDRHADTSSVSVRRPGWKPSACASALIEQGSAGAEAPALRGFRYLAWAEARALRGFRHSSAIAPRRLKPPLYDGALELTALVARGLQPALTVREEQALDVPERVVIEHRRLEVAEIGARADKHVRRREEDERQLLRHDRLNAIEQALALARIERHELFFHQVIDLGLPR